MSFLKQVVLWYLMIQAVQDDQGKLVIMLLAIKLLHICGIIVLAGCTLLPKVQDVYLDEWFDLSFEVNCDIGIEIVHWYTSGFQDAITENTTIKDYVNESDHESPPECNNDGKKNYSISIYLTDVVHQHLNEVITAMGENPHDTSKSCISLPSARYYLKQNVNVQGQSKML